LQFGKGDVGRCLVSVQDQPGVRLDPHRTSIAALLLWRRRPLLVCRLLPPDRASGADAEPYRRLSAARRRLDHADTNQHAR
jgi:hypothetical protein